jgi:hypothetical protein
MARVRGSKIFEDEPSGRRRLGRPILRWVDGVESHLKTMVVRRWRNVVNIEKNGCELCGRAGHCMGLWYIGCDGVRLTLRTAASTGLLFIPE